METNMYIYVFPELRDASNAVIREVEPLVRDRIAALREEYAFRVRSTVKPEEKAAAYKPNYREIPREKQLNLPERLLEKICTHLLELVREE